jgi:hypothetical protein
VPCFLNELRQACKTAKPLCVGSIPTRASTFQKLRCLHKRLPVAL